MRPRTFSTLLAGAAVTAAVMAAGPSVALSADNSGPGAAIAVLHDAEGAVVGTVTLHGRPGGATTVSVRAKGLTPGFHGFHVHAVGICEPPFTSAGGHFNPDNTDHGAHAGDMPPLYAQQDGTARLEFQTDAYTVADLFDADGSAVIIHADRDNLAHIPSRYTSDTGESGPDAATRATGDAGSRFACGVVR